MTQTSPRILGQVFTPPAVADFMVRWATSHKPRRILDPSLGRGIFVERLAAMNGALSVHAQITACEIDSAMVAAFQRNNPAPDLPVDVRRTDFLTARFDKKFDAVICNPPYIRHHDAKPNASIFERFDRLIGTRISRLTNIYGLFLLRLWSLLADHGRAAAITPAEWLNADFGRAIKSYLLLENAIDAIVHFDHASEIFDGVLTTAAITLLRRGRKPTEPVRFQSVRSAGELATPRSVIDYRSSDLNPKAKWSALFTRRIPSTGRTTPLGVLARCVRGIATGANTYFVLKPSDLNAAGIERSDVQVCVYKSAHVRGERLAVRDIQRLIADDERIFLVCPREPLSPAVKRYLERGRMLNIHRRYLPSHRPTWYRPEHRDPAPIWVNVFARGCFRFIRNEAGVLHLTCFHAIYPNPGVDADALHAALCKAAAGTEMKSETRIYADGLSKLEPRDVERIPIRYSKRPPVSRSYAST